MNTGCGQNAECSVLKLSVRLAIALLAGLKSACFNLHRVLKSAVSGASSLEY